MLGVRVPPGLPAFWFLILGPVNRTSGNGGPGVRGVESMSQFMEKLKSSLKSAVEFLKDTRKELNNVSWPSRRELTGTTLVVIVAVFFFGFFLYVVDVVVSTGMNYIFHRATQ
jgi:preprotein translocase subunit SecE